MLNSLRQNEILEEIRKIEMEQEEIDDCIKKLHHDEDDIYDELQGWLWGMSNEFEMCYGDQHLTAILEERNVLLQRAISGCDDFKDGLTEARRNIRRKCESDIDDLKDELRRLELV